MGKNPPVSLNSCIRKINTERTAPTKIIIYRNMNVPINTCHTQIHMCWNISHHHISLSSDSYNFQILFIFARINARDMITHTLNVVVVAQLKIIALTHTKITFSLDDERIDYVVNIIRFDNNPPTMQLTWIVRGIFFRNLLPPRLSTVSITKKKKKINGCRRKIMSHENQTNYTYV